MTPLLAARISRTIALIAPVLILAWDAFAYYRFGHTATISHFLWTTSQKSRWFALAVMLLTAFLMWHFFVP